ncbi:hypothetical protein LX32DRAFT_633735 [Colletotrichum zoysiae]|uniref:Uncharacterized protein n=1 Tax=Colletotrichum zoysiae TaxID=1216348 RepID=A0AAD9HUG1_9PEZI|nr:hypothetical protein LX32DRAFT_633735 [Colletotrichum zoysiae]
MLLSVLGVGVGVGAGAGAHVVLLLMGSWLCFLPGYTQARADASALPGFTSGVSVSSVLLTEGDVSSGRVECCYYSFFLVSLFVRQMAQYLLAGGLIPRRLRWEVGLANKNGVCALTGGVYFLSDVGDFL